MKKERKSNKKNILDIIRENYIIMKSEDFFNIEGLPLILEFFYISVKEIERSNNDIDYLVILRKKEKYSQPYSNLYFL